MVYAAQAGAVLAQVAAPGEGAGTRRHQSRLSASAADRPGGCHRLFEVLPSRVELEIVRVIDTPEATHIRYRVRRWAGRPAASWLWLVEVS